MDKMDASHMEKHDDASALEKSSQQAVPIEEGKHIEGNIQLINANNEIRLVPTPR